MASGDYYWNSGIFMFRASTYLDELGKHAPDILACCRQAMDNAIQDTDFLRVDEAAFSQCPSDSIDYAIMEKTSRAVVAPLQAEWSDLGSWDALWHISEHDDDGNTIRG